MMLPFAQQLLPLIQSLSYRAHTKTGQDKSDEVGPDPYEVECSTASQSENPQFVDHTSPPLAANTKLYSNILGQSTNTCFYKYI